MTNPSHTPPNPLADPAACRAALLRQIEVLDQLAAMGIDLARAITTQGIEAATPNDAAMPFSRVARAVRMTVLLQSQLIKGPDEPSTREAMDIRFGWDSNLSGASDQAEDDERPDPACDQKARVAQIVARVAQAKTDDLDHVERIRREAAERLDHDDIYGDVLTRPVGELVALICRDLGLTPDWQRLAQEAWAQAEIRSGVPGSPVARMLNHQGHQEDRYPTPERSGAYECAARLGELGVLGGSTFSGPEGASP